MDADGVRAGFRVQAEWGRRMGVPFSTLLFECLGEVVDTNSATGRAVLAWTGDPMRDALVLRVAGGLHALVRGGRVPELAACYPPAPLPDPARLRAALAAVFADPVLDAAVLTWLDSAPQTNEVARSGVLMPGLMVVAEACQLPLRLFELGSSAGLNLCLDRWAYNLGGVEAGPKGAPVWLAPAWTGAPPPDQTPTITERRGVDLNPLDVRDPATATRLTAFVWPDQPERVARAEAAIAAVALDPPVIDRADAADWVEPHVTSVDGVTTVVMHSIAFQYFPDASRARIAAHMAAVGAAATAAAPLAWLRYEFEAVDGSPATLRLTLWRGAGAEDWLLAHAHPHGATIEWFGTGKAV